MNLIEEFGDFANDVMQQVQVLKRQNIKLRQARDVLLLPRLISGRIAI